MVPTTGYLIQNRSSPGGATGTHSLIGNWATSTKTKLETPGNYGSVAAMNVERLSRSAVYLRLPALIGEALAICALVCLSACGQKKGATDNTTSDGPMQKPATVEQAAQVLDLSTFPLMDGAKPERSHHMANLTYAATGDVKNGFDFHQKKLTAQGWKELPNSSVTEQSASAMFARSGFILSLSVFSSGKGGDLSVMLQNLGNVKPGQLPVPPGTKKVYVGDSTAMYATEAAVPATAEACRNLLVAQGWVPYGSAGDTVEYKQNAILVTATVSVAPAQDGKTMIQYSTQLISSDIPPPPNVEELRYVDTPPELTFDTAASQDAVVDFYRKTLAATGWQSTLDHTVPIDDLPTMIFRNPGKDMLTLSMAAGPRGKLHASVRFQSAAEIAELDRKIKEMAPALRAAAQEKEAKEAARLAEANKPPPKVSVTLPADAKDVDQTKDRIKFTVGKGKAQAAAEALRAQFREAGYKEDFATVTQMTGALSFSKEKQSLTLTYTDTGMSPPEINLSAIFAELEVR